LLLQVKKKKEKTWHDITTCPIHHGKKCHQSFSAKLWSWTIRHRLPFVACRGVAR